MRTMLRIHIDSAHGSEALKSGAMQKAIGAFIETFAPEATYFTLDQGMRTGFFVFDLRASQQMPEVGEPFLALGRKVSLAPCMTPEDLQAGFTAIGL